MRLKINTICIVALAILCISTASAQQFEDKKSTVVQFDLTLMPSLLDGLDPYSPTTLREKENFKKAKTYIQKILIDKMNALVLERLGSEQMVAMQPIDVLEDYKVVYNPQGYPNTVIAKSVIKKVNKKGYSSDFYFAIKTTIEPAMDILGKSKLTKQIKDKVSLNIVVFDGQGNKLGRYEGNYKADAPKKAKSFPSGKFDKMDIGYMDLLLEALVPGMTEAVDKVINAMGAKS